eukprot:m.38555 g.38555  ORF g.38555 m.38555 type:complete len:152 (+) comp11663_c0_seq1:955-1410(+)
MPPAFKEVLGKTDFFDDFTFGSMKRVHREVSALREMCGISHDSLAANLHNTALLLNHLVPHRLALVTAAQFQHSLVLRMAARLAAPHFPIVCVRLALERVTWQIGGSAPPRCLPLELVSIIMEYYIKSRVEITIDRPLDLTAFFRRYLPGP